MDYNIVIISEWDINTALAGAYVSAADLSLKGDSDIRIYCTSVEDDDVKMVEDTMEAVLSHESLHLAIWGVTHNLEAVRALDNIEGFRKFDVSYPF